MFADLRPKAVAFDRNELAGAFGDLGVAIPLITAMLILNDLDPTSVLVLFGLLHIYTGFSFGLPMPVQPLKAMAAIMITSQPPKEWLFGAGLVVGVFFTILALTNAIEVINRAVPRSVIRGIQLGLGINLIMIAGGYMQREPVVGWILSFAGVVVTILLFNNRRIPPALVIVALGIAVSVSTGFPKEALVNGFGFSLPKLFIPAFNDVMQGTLALAIPQIPLSLGNSILATSLLASDLFPSRPVSTRKLSSTYGVMNLVSPFFGGIPVCHGSGGLAGHYRFGGRTGGAVIIIGLIFLVIGLFFGGVVGVVLSVFPFALLGVLLFFSGLELTLTVRDVVGSREDLFVAMLVAAFSVSVTYGYVVGLAGGMAVAHLLKTGRPRLFER